MRHVIVPYDGQAGQTLPKEKETWNYHLFRCRMAVEHTFGLLKGRFSNLKGLPAQINNSSDLARKLLGSMLCHIAQFLNGRAT